MTPEEWVRTVVKQDEAIETGFDDTYQDRKTLDLFWRRQGAVQLEQWGEKVAAAFLGVRLECAQCHKHPTDRWTQADYRSFANLFAQVNFVDRVAAHYFGVGLVEPVDDFSVANPPTNARLLVALARDFVGRGYDVRHLERTILNARTYRLSAVPNATNKFDKNNFARGY